MTRGVVTCLGAVLAALALVGGSQGEAQQTDSASGGVVFKTTVRNVIVDVVVTDAHGQPVRNLTRKDFSVTEDGKPQRILTFDPHDMDVWAETLPAKLPAHTYTNLPTEPERGPLYVLFYDLSRFREPNDQVFARQQLVKFIGSRAAGTRFAILANSDGMHLIQGFTADRGLLCKALDVNGKTPHMPMNFLYGSNYPIDYLTVLKDIVGYVKGLPGRKNIIWVSGSYPFGVFAPSDPQTVDEYRRELAYMAGNQIAIYPVDAKGVSVDARVQTEFLIEDEVAEETGGHAYYSTNDLAGALDKATDDGSTYYTLSYAPTNSTYDGGLRHIEVKLQQKGYQLSYRRQYYADKTDSDEEPPYDRAIFSSEKPVAALPPPDTLYTFIRHGMPMSHEVVFSAHVRPLGAPRLATAEQMADLSDEPAYFRRRRKNRPPKPLPPVPIQSYVIDYAIPSQQFRLQPGMKDAEQDTLEFAAAAYNSDEYLLNGTIDHATSTTKGKSSFYQVEQPFDVPATAASISLAVRDVDTGRIGNLEIALPLKPEPPPPLGKP